VRSALPITMRGEIGGEGAVSQLGRRGIPIEYGLRAGRPPHYLIRAGAGGLLVVIGGCGVEFGDSALTAPLK
jgi:hypothetical protein